MISNMSGVEPNRAQDTVLDGFSWGHPSMMLGLDATS